MKSFMTSTPNVTTRVAQHGEVLEAVVADIQTLRDTLEAHAKLLSALAESQKAHLDVLAVHSARLDALPGPGLLSRLRWLVRG